jgi:phospholipid transport system substrate-binding protein
MPAFAAEADDAVAVVRKLQDSQIEVLSRGKTMTLRQRFDALRPALGAAFDLEGMAKLAYGPGFDDVAERGDWVRSFGDYVAATYAQRFEFVEAKGFERDVKVEPRDGALVVSTRMIPVSGEPMPVDYVVKATPQGWRIADILANGSISELTQWRRALKGLPLKDLRQRAASLLER